MHDEYRPSARQGLLVETIGDELLLFDTESKRAHSLNSIAAAVWQACDGIRDQAEIAVRCGIDEPTLALALDRLRAAHLLDEPRAAQLLDETNVPVGVSRRSMIRRSLTAGAALGVAIPVIRSITAPTPAMAATNGRVKGNAGVHCTNSSPCSAGSRCNHHYQSCQRTLGASCVHGSSCSHSSIFGGYGCRNSVCTNCSKTSQCASGFTCSGGGRCV